MAFHLGVDYRPRGDQAAAIDQLFRGLLDGEKHQTLLGVTGSGKTYTMAQLTREAIAERFSYSLLHVHRMYYGDARIALKVRQVEAENSIYLMNGHCSNDACIVDLNP
jgi:hypothetical protein